MTTRYEGRRNVIKSRTMFLVGACLFAGTILQSAAVRAAGKPTIKVIDPSSVPLIIYKNSPSMVDGRQVYRRPVSFAKDGSENIDISYDMFKAGINIDKPFTYNRDEICYQVAGEAETQNDGVVTILKPGNFMWHPAGTPTETIKIITDNVIVCAFGPARRDDISHIIPTPEFGKWVPDESKRPRAHIFDWKHIGPTSTSKSPVSDDASVVYREVISVSKDGATSVDANHNTYKAGTMYGRYTYAEDEVCYLESGQLQLTADGSKMTINKGDFVYRPAGAISESTKIIQDTTTVCFFGPARKVGWSEQGLEP